MDLMQLVSTFLMSKGFCESCPTKSWRKRKNIQLHIDLSSYDHNEKVEHLMPDRNKTERNLKCKPGKTITTQSSSEESSTAQQEK